MKKIVLAFTLLGASASQLLGDAPRILRASFPDGSGLEIFTETTGSSSINAVGGMGIGPGSGSQDRVNRVVVDGSHKILFAYNLEASRGANPNSVMIRIEPISAASEASIIKSASALGYLQFPGAHLPTVARAREFAAVRIGEAVTLDILYNPSTGERVFDVLRPIATATTTMSVTTEPALPTLSLKDIRLRVNGRQIPAPGSFLIGSAVRLDIPGHGVYVIAAYQPHEAPSNHAFAAIVNADGKTLSWSVDGDHIEITSATNVLPQSDHGLLWVYHDSRNHPDVVGLQSADSVDWLLPRK